MPATLLEALSRKVNIDADTLDTDCIQNLPITCHDCTSNPKLVLDALTHPSNQALIDPIVSITMDLDFTDAYAALFAHIQSKILQLISGRVMTQALASQSYDTDGMVETGRKFAAGWKAAGIPITRTAVKLPMTGAGAQAGAILEREGIPVMGTSLFSVQQAIAAQQAGLHAIQLYFNDPRGGSKKDFWPDVEDVVLQHPMACRHARIRRLYDELAKEGQKVPLIKTSALYSPRESVATLELGADHITLIKLSLEDLAAGPGFPKYRPGLWKVPVAQQALEADFVWESWEPVQAEAASRRITQVVSVDSLSSKSDDDEWMAHYLDTNYLSPGVLDEEIEKDPYTAAALSLKIEQFCEFEKQTREWLGRKRTLSR